MGFHESGFSESGRHRSSGRPYVLVCFILFCHSISELPWPITVKLCHMIGIWLNFIMQVQKLGAWNKSRYPKSDRYVIQNDSFHVWQKKSGELWSAIQKVGHVSLDPVHPSRPFLGDYISAIRGCWHLKFLYALQLHTPQACTWSPKNFKGEHLIFLLKLNIYNFGVPGVTSQTSKMWRNFWQLLTLSRISWKWIDTTKIWKAPD